MKTGIELITDERTRQIEVEGWTPEHDQEHADQQMAEAAMCYIARTVNMPSGDEYSSSSLSDFPPEAWPWSPKWWKPDSHPVRNLVKAGALLAAEIDRIQNQHKQA